MAFLKTARAVVENPHVSRRAWGEIRTAGRSLGRLPNFSRSRVASAAGSVPTNLVDQASAIFNETFDPEKYLLTHATIVASVDVYQPPGAKTGSVFEDGFRVNRRYGDFRVKSECQQFINNNRDAWSRGVLLKAFETFIGGHNFVEHVQIESMSKGRIIDAVARDIGDSVYIDILIATDRKHADLVAAIESGKMGTMSMGCTVDGTICTKCGHWAADETEMCPHIKYQKGNTFIDEHGRQHIIAELCGHESLDPTGGVTFIEASWVETPAFTGAVLRNVMEASDSVAAKAAHILNTPPPQWSPEAHLKAAGMQRSAVDISVLEAAAAQDGRVVARVSHGPLTSPAVLSVGASPSMEADLFLSGWEDFDEEGGDGGDGEGEGGSEPKDTAPSQSPMDEVKEDLKKHLRKQVQKQIKDEIKNDDVSDALDSTAPNDTVQHEATYRAGLDAIVRTASSDVALVDAVAAFNKAAGVQIPVPIYRAALKLGASDKYSGSTEFVRACHAVLGRQPNPAEIRVLARLSSLLSRRSSARSGNHHMAVATEGADQ
jgi:hypothetical protein